MKWFSLGLWLCALAAPVCAQDALARLLEAAPQPSVRELLEALGPAPPLADLLAPEVAAPVQMLELDPADDERARELEAAALEALKDGRLEAAAESAAASLDALRAGLRDEHPRVVDARSLRDDVALLLSLPEEPRAAALAAWRRVDEIPPSLRGSSVEQAARALQAYRAAFPRATGRANRLLGSLAVFVYQRGDPASAERLATLATYESLELQGRVHPATASGLSNLAYFLTAARRFADAEAVHAHALDVRRTLDGADDLGYARALFNVAQLLRTERPAEAERVLARALELRLAHGADDAEVGVTRSQLGYVLRQLGRYDEARSELEAALALFEGSLPPDHHERAQALQHLVIVERDVGDFAVAARYADAAVAMYDRLFPDGHVLSAHSHLTHATLDLRRGELDAAERHVREAERIFGRFVPAGHAYLLETRATLAAVLQAKGDLAGTRDVIDANLRARRGVFGERSLVIADDLARLAQLRLELGEAPAALEAVDEELAIAIERLGADHPRTAAARLRRAECLLAEGQLAAADAELTRARAALDDEGGGVRAVTRARLDWLEGRRRLAGATTPDARRAALESYDAALRRLRAIDERHPLLIELELEAGEALLASDPAAAAEHLARALEVAEALRVRVLGDELDRATYAGRLALDRAARSLARARALAGDAPGALSAAERGRGRALLDLLARAGSDLIPRAGTGSPSPTAELALRLIEEEDARARLVEREEAVRKRRARASAANPPGEAELEALLEEVEVQRRALREAGAAVARELTDLYPNAAAVGAEQVLAALDEGQELLHYTFDERGAVLLTTLGDAGLVAHVLARDARAAAELRAAVVDWTEALRAGGALDPAALASLSATLLPAPVARALARTARVVIVPDGPLHGLPFESLALEGTGWLDAGPRCSYAHSGSVLARGAGRAASGERAARALVLGAPRFEGGAAADAGAPRGSGLDAYRLFGATLAPLPGAGIEARRVAARLVEAGFEVAALEGAGAGEPDLRRLAPGARVLHLATHGFRAPAERPYEAALALASPRQRTASDDGFLTLDELVRGWGGVLAGCELVTLSACDTNAGTAVGDSVVSLSWGFFHAGAESVLVSLWKVDDRATLLLMDRFYREWAGGARARGAALTEARRWLAASTPAQNRARLAELGALDEAGGERGPQDGFPRPGADPTARAADARFDFRHPRHWSAFVLFGADD